MGEEMVRGREGEGEEEGKEEGGGGVHCACGGEEAEGWCCDGGCWVLEVGG